MLIMIVQICIRDSLKEETIGWASGLEHAWVDLELFSHKIQTSLTEMGLWRLTMEKRMAKRKMVKTKLAVSQNENHQKTRT